MLVGWRVVWFHWRTAGSAVREGDPLGLLASKGLVQKQFYFVY